MDSSLLSTFSTYFCSFPIYIFYSLLVTSSTSSFFFFSFFVPLLETSSGAFGISASKLFYFKTWISSWSSADSILKQNAINLKAWTQSASSTTELCRNFACAVLNRIIVSYDLIVIGNTFVCEVSRDVKSLCRKTDHKLDIKVIESSYTKLNWTFALQ